MACSRHGRNISALPGQGQENHKGMVIFDCKCVQGLSELKEILSQANRRHALVSSRIKWHLTRSEAKAELANAWKLNFTESCVCKSSAADVCQQDGWDAETLESMPWSAG